MVRALMTQCWSPALPARRWAPAAAAAASAQGRRCPAGEADPALPAGHQRPVGLNRVCVRPVPAWQRGISDFLQLPSKESRASDGDTPGTSGLEARPLPLDPAEEGECLEEE
ncbi:PCNA-associated factor isoform X2 [Molothrus aeneus]|uniref:PCNA-associated factor isoform X2 n=1 Tax=Molothrus aeneus TaxID=84833 RepID=UPI0034577D6C